MLKFLKKSFTVFLTIRLLAYIVLLLHGIVWLMSIYWYRRCEIVFLRAVARKAFALIEPNSEQTMMNITEWSPAQWKKFGIGFFQVCAVLSASCKLKSSLFSFVLLLEYAKFCSKKYIKWIEVSFVAMIPVCWSEWWTNLNTF